MSDTTSNVLSFSVASQIRKAEEQNHDYSSRILALPKELLLEEMVTFQEERKQTGKLTLPLMVKGRILFRQLEKTAISNELKLLTQSYRKHLDLELHQYVNDKQLKNATSIDYEDFRD